MNKTHAEVKSVVSDKSAPPIPYLGFNSNMLKVFLLSICSKVNQASVDVSRMLKSFISKFFTNKGFSFALFTFLSNSEKSLIVPNPGLAFFQHFGSVHSSRL